MKMCGTLTIPDSYTNGLNPQEIMLGYFHLQQEMQANKTSYSLIRSFYVCFGVCVGISVSANMI